MIRKSILFIILLLILFSTLTYADDLIDAESRYGLSFELSRSFFPGAVVIDGTFIYETEDDYIITVLYSGGELVTTYNDGIETVATSFFNPPSGDQLMIYNNFKLVSSTESMIKYRINKEALLKCDGISIFLYDKIFGHDDDKNISLYFKLNNIDFEKVPTVDQIDNGHIFQSTRADAELTSEPSSWALNKVEELKINGIYRTSAFESFKSGITRLRFVYLMVELYESLSGTEVVLSSNLSFTDTSDIHALKAAQIEITSGIGNQQFGPDIILTREQMAAFVVKTLMLSGVSLDTSSSDSSPFSDHNQISDWAKESIYISKVNMLINGVGDNEYAPKLSATNEQSLVLIHSILSRFGNLKHYKEIDNDSIYVRSGSNLNKIPLTENVLVNRTVLGNDLYMKSIEDMEQLLSIAHGQINEFDEQFDRVIYYDMNNVRRTLHSIPVQNVFDSLGIEYSVEYNKSLGIYIIEFQENN
ncbi:MAG: hypothetical protein SCL54_08885 [Bacillota bacterium]|nr:hypothetical protein [Bacillota bacterium]